MTDPYPCFLYLHFGLALGSSRCCSVVVTISFGLWTFDFEFGASCRSTNRKPSKQPTHVTQHTYTTTLAFFIYLLIGLDFRPRHTYAHARTQQPQHTHTHSHTHTRTQRKQDIQLNLERKRDHHLDPFLKSFLFIRSDYTPHSSTTTTRRNALHSPLLHFSHATLDTRHPDTQIQFLFEKETSCPPLVLIGMEIWLVSSRRLID